MDSDWVYHRDTGVARVVERLPGRKLVVGNASGRTTLERGYRYLPNDSLRVLGATDPGELQRLIGDEPAEIAERLLLEREPIAVSDAVGILGEVGCSPRDVERWTAVLPEALGGTRISVDDGVICFRVEVMSDDDLSKLIEGAVGQEGSDAYETIKQLVSNGSLSPSQMTAAALVIKPPADPDDIDTVLHLDSKALQLVTQQMRSAEGLVTIVLRSVGVNAARTAVDRIKKLRIEPDPFLVTHLASLLDALRAQKTVGADLWIDAAQTISRLGLFEGGLSTAASSLAIQIASIERNADEPNKRRIKAHTSMDRSLEELQLHPVALPALLRGEAAGASEALVAFVGSTLPLAANGFRLSQITAVAASPAVDLLAERDSWNDISIAELAALVHERDSQLAELLVIPAVRRGLSRRVDRVLYSLSPKLLGDLLGAPEILELADPARVAEALSELLGSTPALSRINERIVEPAVVGATERAALALEEHRREAAASEGRLLGDRDRLASDLAETMERLKAMESLVRGESGRAASATDAQLRQAWIDAAQVAVDVVEEVRRFAGVGEAGQPVVDAALGLLRAAGIHDEGTAGSERSFDPGLFRRLDQGETSTVTVVEPAYVTDRFGGVTIVRYGTVRDSGRA